MTEQVVVVIDIQRDYFPGGRHPLVGSEEAAARAGELLAAARERGGRIVHVRHESASGFLERGTGGADIHPAVAPREGETVVVKEHPNAFLDTGLEGVLGDPATTELVVAGMMTSMCVDATVRAASDAGYRVTVASDACAAPDLTHDGVRVNGSDVHTAFLAALAQGYARVAPVAAITSESPVPPA